MVSREVRVDRALARRREARDRIHLDPEATDRLNEAREALGLTTKENPA